MLSVKSLLAEVITLQKTQPFLFFVKRANQGHQILICELILWESKQFIYLKLCKLCKDLPSPKVFVNC